MQLFPGQENTPKSLDVDKVALNDISIDEEELIDYFSQEESEPIDIDSMSEDEINELIDRKRSNKPKDGASNIELAQKFLTYFREKGRRFADRKGGLTSANCNNIGVNLTVLTLSSSRCFLTI